MDSDKNANRTRVSRPDGPARSSGGKPPSRAKARDEGPSERGDRAAEKRPRKAEPQPFDGARTVDVRLDDDVAAELGIDRLELTIHGLREDAELRMRLARNLETADETSDQKKNRARAPRPTPGIGERLGRTAKRTAEASGTMAKGAGRGAKHAAATAQRKTAAAAHEAGERVVEPTKAASAFVKAATAPEPGPVRRAGRFVRRQACTAARKVRRTVRKVRNRLVKRAVKREVRKAPSAVRDAVAR